MTVRIASADLSSLAGAAGTRSSSERGFTYIGLLILVAVIGIATVASVQIGSVLQRRASEEELLAIGNEFRSALISYSMATPVGQKRFPVTIDDLLKDPRYPETRRHLRKRYADPLTGKEDWGIVQTPDGTGIVGFYSLSDGKPVKIGNFAPPFQLFEGTTSYHDWKFMIGVL
jgi:type II secretory pathway pseudopilin PulG